MPWTSKYEKLPADYLRGEWLDSLAILQTHILRTHRATETLRLAPMVPRISPTVQLNGKIARSHYLLKREKNQHGAVTFMLHPEVEHWYRVERIEALLYVGALCIWDANTAVLKDLDMLCNVLGCCPDNIADPKERWRKIGIVRNAATMLAISELEDRPLCVMCRTPVATGNLRKDAHDNCYIYGRDVLAPALKAARLKGIRQVDPAKEGG